MTVFPYNGRIYLTRIERLMAQRRDGALSLPSLDFTCTGADCRCPHHQETTDD